MSAERLLGDSRDVLATLPAKHFHYLTKGECKRCFEYRRTHGKARPRQDDLMDAYPMDFRIARAREKARRLYGH